MRRMSFALTTRQYEAREKTVTRRLGWWNLRPGDVVMGIEKGMGLAKGEKQRELHPFEVVSVRAERLDAITVEDCIAEGFPDLMPWAFVLMFCRHNGCEPSTPVNRIEFRHLP